MAGDRIDTAVSDAARDLIGSRTRPSHLRAVTAVSAAWRSADRPSPASAVRARYRLRRTQRLISSIRTYRPDAERLARAWTIATEGVPPPPPRAVRKDPLVSVVERALGSWMQDAEASVSIETDGVTRRQTIRIFARRCDQSTFRNRFWDARTALIAKGVQIAFGDCFRSGTGTGWAGAIRLAAPRRTTFRAI